MTCLATLTLRKPLRAHTTGSLTSLCHMHDCYRNSLIVYSYISCECALPSLPSWSLPAEYSFSLAGRA